MNQFSSGFTQFPGGGVVTRQQFNTNFAYPNANANANERGAVEQSHDHEDDSYMEGDDDDYQ